MLWVCDGELIVGACSLVCVGVVVLLIDCCLQIFFPWCLFFFLCGLLCGEGKRGFIFCERGVFLPYVSEIKGALGPALTL